jgi:hypothetical protein
MYDYIKNQWIMSKFTKINIDKCVSKGYINQEQADEIMAMNQIII